jgi:hypothetical protein
LCKALPPCICSSGFAKRFFHVDNPRRGTRGAWQPRDRRSRTP